jgi:hypothetical protein
MSMSTSRSRSTYKSISISMCWLRSWSTSNSGSGDRIFGGMKPNKMDNMTIWRLRDYDIVVQPNLKDHLETER